MMEVPDEKLYREVTLKNGQYEGIHRIYWNSYVCEKFTGQQPVKWSTTLDIPVGGYIESEDGTCLQLLDRRRYKDKRNRIFFFFRFATTTIPAYITTSGEIKYRRFYGNYMTATKNGLKSKTFAGSENQKLRFVSYIISGLNPIKAIRLAFGYKYTTPITTLHRMVNKMLQDKVVQQELRDQLIPLKEQIGKTFSTERLVKELESLMDSSRKGSSDHRENIKFIMGILDILPESMKPKSQSVNRVPEIPYEEVPVPQLGKIDD